MNGQWVCSTHTEWNAIRKSEAIKCKGKCVEFEEIIFSETMQTQKEKKGTFSHSTIVSNSKLSCMSIQLNMSTECRVVWNDDFCVGGLKGSVRLQVIWKGKQIMRKWSNWKRGWDEGQKAIRLLDKASRNHIIPYTMHFTCLEKRW